jgi:hypothetical protein
MGMKPLIHAVTAITALVAATAIAVHAEEPAGIREPEKLVFEGVKTGGLKEVQTALKADFDLLLAAHPSSSLSGYLRAIEETTLLAYRHSGFPDAKVTAKFDEQQERIVVQVHEGSRRFCGDTKVTGAKLADVAALIQSVAGPAKKNGASPFKDRPAPFDESTRREIQKRLKDAFAAQGFFSPSFDAQVHAQSDEATATLLITVNDEGPQAEIGNITIAGNERDSDSDILNYLNLRAGDRYDSGLAGRLKARLEESSRFLAARIDRVGPSQLVDDKREIVDVRIDLRDYEFAPPLTADFADGQQALLKFRDWLGRWSRGETEFDLVFDGSFTAAAVAQMCAEMDMPMPPIEQGPVQRCDLRVIVGPGRGLFVAVRLFNHEGTLLLDDVVVFYPDNLVVASPKRRAMLRWPLGSGNQTTLTLTAAPAKEPDEKGKRFQFMFGLTFKSNSRVTGPPMFVKSEAAASAILSFLDSSDATCRRESDVWRLQRGDLHGLSARLDAETGRLIEFGGSTSSEDDTDDNSSHAAISVRTESGAWEREAAKVEARLSGATEYDAEAPWKSLCEFAADELAFVVRQHGHADDPLAAVEAVRKLVHRWSPPAFADLWPAEWNDDSTEGARFALPLERTRWDFKELTRQGPARNNAVPAALLVYRQLAPADGWLWPAGRDLLLCRDTRAQTAQMALWRSIQTGEIGPAGCLALTSLAHGWRTQVAQAGQRDTSLAAFRKDYQPLLSGDGWLSRWLLSLAEAIRTLDEAELQALPALLDEGPVRELAAKWLLLLKTEPEQPVAAAVARMLDAAWAGALRDVVAKKLQQVSPTEPLHNDRLAERLKAYGPVPGGALNEGKTGPKLPGFSDSPTANALRGLDRLSEDAQQGDSPKTEKKDDRPEAIAPQDKSWLDKPALPRKPASPFPESGDR